MDEMLGKGCLRGSRGFPAAQQDFGMDTTQQPWQGGVWPPWGAWAWAPQGIRWCHAFRLLGDDCRQRGLASVCGKQGRVIMTFLCIGKVCLDFHGNKRPHICCRSCPQANLKSLLRIGGCWSCRRRVLVFYIRQRRNGDTVFVQPRPQKWANYFG